MKPRRAAAAAERIHLLRGTEYRGGIMKPILSIAVLLIALSVMTDSASAEDSTIGQKLESVGTKIREFASTVGDKTKETFDKIHKSEFVTNTRNWFSEVGQKMKDAFKSK